MLVRVNVITVGAQETGKGGRIGVQNQGDHATQSSIMQHTSAHSSLVMTILTRICLLTVLCSEVL